MIGHLSEMYIHCSVHATLTTCNDPGEFLTAEIQFLSHLRLYELCFPQRELFTLNSMRKKQTYLLYSIIINNRMFWRVGWMEIFAVICKMTHTRILFSRRSVPSKHTIIIFIYYISVICSNVFFPAISVFFFSTQYFMHLSLNYYSAKCCVLSIDQPK